MPLRIAGSNGQNLHVACVVTYLVNTQTHRSKYAILSNTSYNLMMAELYFLLYLVKEDIPLATFTVTTILQNSDSQQ